jgi:hypothetical protein
MSVHDNSLVERWLVRVDFAHRLRYTLLVFLAPLMAAAIIPAAITILFDADSDVQPQRIEATPTPTSPKAIPETTSEAISEAWDAVQASNDIYTLNGFISRFPASQYAEEARKRVVDLEQSEKMQMADAGVNPQMIAQLLENKDSEPDSLDKFLAAKGFYKEYSLGFAIFYSDGRKTLYHAENTNPDVKFDPATIRVLNLTPTKFCLSGFYAIVKRTRLFMDPTCIGSSPGSILNFMKINGVTIRAESLGGSSASIAWIIGLTP